MMKEYAIIVAGGSGLRMQSSVPKQFREICGRPVLFYTIEAFFQYSSSLQIILVLPENQISLWERLKEENKFSIEVHIQSGGTTRFQSVKNGLELIEDEGLVAVHDGVRPLINPLTIRKAFQTAGKKGSAVVCTTLKESIREISGKTSVARNRNNYFLVQTPQVFKVGELKAAYQTKEIPSFTDDASVAEKAGIEIHVVEGDYENIKITTPEDMAIAETILKERSNKSEL